MHSFFASLVFILLLGSGNLWAMNKPCYVDKTSLSVIIFNGDFDLDEFLNLSQLNNTTHALFNEDTWFLVYKITKGTSEKVRPELTYKQNCQVLNRAYVIYHTAPAGCYIQKDCCYVSPCKIEFCERTTETLMLSMAPLLAEVERKHPLVFATCFGPFYSPDSIKEYKANFDNTLKKDILLILPAGYTNQDLSTQMPDFDIHQRWPHVLWVSTWNNGVRELWASYGSLVHLGVPSVNGTGTANSCLWIVNLVIQMRRLRLDLSAAEIIEILVASATVSDETKLFLPKGGIVNAEEAIRALLRYKQ